MRVIVVMIVFFMLLGLHLSFAQDQASSPGSEPQQTEPRADSSAKQIPNSGDEERKERTLERLGPGIDWDHRKPGRDWQISPRREHGQAKGDRH